MYRAIAKLKAATKIVLELLIQSIETPSPDPHELAGNLTLAACIGLLARVKTPLFSRLSGPNRLLKAPYSGALVVHEQ